MASHGDERAAELVAGLGGTDVVVAGFGTAGRSAAGYLRSVGARVTVVDSAFGAAESGGGLDRVGVDEAVADAALWGVCDCSSYPRGSPRTIRWWR